MELKRKIRWADDTAPEAVAVETPVQTSILAENGVPVPPTNVTRTAPTGPRRRIRVGTVPSRSGNGHVVAKTRDLTEHEQNKIETRLFLQNNGEIKSDLCVEFKTRHMSSDVSIFQVTGYVTALHGRVARGKLHLSNLAAYETFIRQHRTLWRTYDSERYRSMRRLPPANQHRRPRFAAVATVR